MTSPRSVFGNGNDDNSTPRAIEVFKTGGEADSIIMSLITHANDKDDAVRATVSFSILDIGNHQPILVISSLITFMHKKPKARSSAPADAADCAGEDTFT